jgi:cellulose synthase/poly-beta-1,6-N-acetylglucosamine synthase-like glycosyltransferase
MVDDSCELIGVVDSDYQIDSQFLKRCVPLFIDLRVGFIQAPQDYRDWEEAPYLKRLYYSYQYFFAVPQPSRNERDGFGKGIMPLTFEALKGQRFRR